MVQNVPEVSNMLQKTLKYPRRFHNVPEGSRKIHRDPKEEIYSCPRLLNSFKYDYHLF